ncbi:MAG: hypothetical protein JNK79_15900 [Chitinophagaceae bacterium]|nr:hypothetical protein [Chitinophagaceae bacterium]
MMYKVALFLHVTGALFVGAAIAIEWICLIMFRKADTIQRVEESMDLYAKFRKLGDLGALLLLVPGIYMMIAVGSNAGWAICGFFGLLLIGATGELFLSQLVQLPPAGNIGAFLVEVHNQNMELSHPMILLRLKRCEKLAASTNYLPRLPLSVSFCFRPCIFPEPGRTSVSACSMS